MAAPRPASPPPWRRLAAAALLHALLWLVAAIAWNGGPFRGQAVLDGAEFLALARGGSAGPFETKSPLVPWLYGRALALSGEEAWTSATLGLGASLATLLGAGLLAWRLSGPRAALAAALLYALSGSALAFWRSFSANSTRAPT